MRDLLNRLERDLTLDAIAAEMGLSVNTVKTHLKKIYRTLGVKNRKEASAVARNVSI